MAEQVKPEALYKISKMEDIDEIIPFQTEVVGTAIRFDSRNREVIVDIGDDFYAFIPENEVTVYDFTYSEGGDIPWQISTIIAKKIRATVIEREGSILKLSRKMSMYNAWKNLENGDIVKAQVTSIAQKGILAFLDVGNGLVSCLYPRDFSKVRISNFENWIKEGDEIKVKILDKGEYPNSKIITSRKQAYPEEEPVDVGDVIRVKVSEQIGNSGYFCGYTPNMTGIIDSNRKLHEGETTRGIVRKITEKGLKLKEM